jgi:hypothetical protein
MHKNQQVKQLKQRHNALAWWTAQMRHHPTGIVPIPTAARILGVSPKRIHRLIVEGRFTVISDMPGGNDRDRFIPIEELINAPFGMMRGRPGEYGPQNRYSKEYYENYPNRRILPNSKCLESK